MLQPSTRVPVALLPWMVMPLAKLPIARLSMTQLAAVIVSPSYDACPELAPLSTSRRFPLEVVLPTMVTVAVMVGSADESVIVFVPDPSLKSITDPGWASALVIAWRSVPFPLSAVLVTSIVLGTRRSSSTSSDNRDQRPPGFRASRRREVGNA